MLKLFYRYIDLTNQEVFLRSQKRIGTRTWANWCEGIEHHLRRPAFAVAWERIKEAVPDDFSELRRLEESRFRDDPADWSPPLKADRDRASDGSSALTRAA